MNTINFSSKKKHNLQHINYDFETDDGIMWVYLDAYPRPCVTPELVSDIRSLHRTIEINNGYFPVKGELEPVHYHVLDSHADGVFSLGGDLSHFLDCIKDDNKPVMMDYARNCINAIYPIMVNFNLPIVTISLVRGSALGGGFEIALSGDVIIAERSAQMGFPEILFNCFPGMGAFQSLSSKIGLTKANQLITSGKLYSATELHELGVVDILVDDNCGENAVYSYIQNHKKHRNGFMAMQYVTQKLKQFNFKELMNICCDLWVDTVFNISEKDIRTISRLLRSQQRYIPNDTYLLNSNASAS
jgi:DSF synthase